MNQPRGHWNRVARKPQRSILTICLLMSVISITFVADSVAAQENPPETETQTGQSVDFPDQGPMPGNVGQPQAPLQSKRVYDMANLLDDREEGKVENDASRLNRFGIPTVIITMSSDITAEQASEFAADVRRQWNVESAAGADDGLVMLIVAGESARRSIFSVMSWGAQALPHMGVDLLISKQIQKEWLDPNLAEFDIYEGILFSLRRFIYLSIYETEPSPPLTDSQSTTRTILQWAAPLLTLAGLLSFLPKWINASRIWSDERKRTIGFVRSWGVPVLTFDLAVASVWARSTIGIVCTLVLIGAMVVTWARTDHAPNSSRTIGQRPIQQGGL